jgi:hypothetical protein
MKLKTEKGSHAINRKIIKKFKSWIKREIWQESRKKKDK